MTDRSASQTAVRTVERYYDFIYFWSQVTNRFRSFREAAAHTIHRGLVNPETGEWSTHHVHDLIARELAGRPAPRALDAGCGYGGTMIAMHERIGGVWRGVTVNRKQVEVAKRSIAGLGLAGAISVERASYDDPLPAAHDLVVAIESMVHSPDPSRTIANLSRALAPGGLFIIVDDMPVEPFPDAFRADLQGFKDGWKCPVLPSDAGWTALLAANGCQLIAAHDLTPLTRPRPEPEIVDALAEVTRKRRWRDRIGLKLVSDAQSGGLHLERLNAAAAVRYMMLVARKR
jgi:SAM-dependent methyltransferase